LTDVAVKNSDHKIKTKIRTLTEASEKNLNKNHIIMIHVTYVILIESLDEIEVDQKIIFSQKNVIITEKIIFVLNAAIQII
jgi:hypothetical protein